MNKIFVPVTELSHQLRSNLLLALVSTVVDVHILTNLQLVAAPSHTTAATVICACTAR